MLAKLRVTAHPDTPFLVVYTDPMRREKSGRSKRVQKWFKKRGAAEAYLDETNKQLQVVGTSGMVFDQVLKSDALAARRELDSAGLAISLLELARAYIRSSPSTKNAGEDLRELLAVFIDEKQHAENRAAETVSDHEKRLTRWFDGDALVTLGDLTTEAVLALRGRPGVGARTRVNDLNSANVFCGWLVDQGKLAVNPVASVKWPIVPKKRPRAWSPEEAKAVLRAAEAYRGGALAAAVGARVFCGLRPSEWSESRVLTAGRAPCVRVEGGKLRGRANRIVPLQPAAVRWFKTYPPAEDGSLPEISARAWQEIHKLANAGRSMPVLWVPDVARHTFISYRVATVHDEAIVAREAGNSPEEIFASYFHLKTEAEAKAFWALRPVSRRASLAP